VNAPLLEGTFDWAQTAITWFGRVSASENYADVRVGYTPTHLNIRVNTFDRLLWFDQTPTSSSLTEWDAVSLYLDLAGNGGGAPGPNSYMFTGQLNWTANEEAWQAAWQGSGSGWQPSGIPFTMSNDWRGNAPNDGNDDKGWSLSFEIPFESLGFAVAPPAGTTWGLGLTLFDRDSASGPPLPSKKWPVGLDGNEPSSWGRLRFGILAYSPPPVSQTSTVEIRHGQAGMTVSDAHVGGGFMCGQPYYPDFFNGWGDANFAGDHKFNIQNQHDVSDWPCFSKTYIIFPLNQIPAGKVIVAANLRLYQQGNSGQGSGGIVPDSFIQVLSAQSGWNESVITWNNAPLAWQNYGGRWVSPMSNPGPPPPPPVPWDWDVSQAVADAYAANTAARLILYSSDLAQHSGKYFLSSESGNSNPALRPTLTVIWGDP
jgi:hypothetical protein